MHSHDVYVYLGHTNVHVLDLFTYYEVLGKWDTEYLIKSDL